MSEYTPTTEQIRDGFTAQRRFMVPRRVGGEVLGSWLMRMNNVSQRDLNTFSGDAFDRWLAAHDERVRTEERERCAQIAEDRRPHIPPSTDPKRRESIVVRSTLNTLAAAIRAVSAEQEDRP